MLDFGFNAKVADFGLAMLMDHGSSGRMTALGGTFGYIAPNASSMGRSIKNQMSIAFGVLGLEIACGRKPFEHNEDESRIRLVERTWPSGRFMLLEGFLKLQPLDNRFEW